MKVLLLGNGAREHAMAWALKRSPLVTSLTIAPGNSGTAMLGENVPLDPTNVPAVLDLVSEKKIDLVVVGPEAPLVMGVSDACRGKGIAVFGPGKKGALLEGSKAFSKNFMKRHSIPTAPFDICTEIGEVEKALKKRTAPYVVKADGLAAGKGAFIIDDLKEALFTAEELLSGRKLGKAGETLVIEDCLSGMELTVLAITDGRNIKALSPSQDHKRVFDEDRGPNTGGMGAYSPVPWADQSIMEDIRKMILEPTLSGLQEEGIPYCGVIYAGLMIDEKKRPSLIEYNVRLGDPEAQVVLPVFEGDFAETLVACCERRLDQLAWLKTEKTAVDVVLASGGYPGNYEKGFPIKGLEELADREDILVFHAGVSMDSQGRFVTDGGRVLSVVGLAQDLKGAVEKAYSGVKQIFFEGMHYRSDIASKAIDFQ